MQARARRVANSEVRSAVSHPWSLVRGVVADFMQVGVEHAAAIDVALGDAAQAVVVDGGTEQVRDLIAAASDLTGRVVAIADAGGRRIAIRVPSS